MYITVQCHIDYHRVRERAYIFESLFGAPPVTLATRRRASSAFRSFSWFRSSAFVFCLSSYTLILAFTFNKSNKKPYSAKSGKKMEYQNQIETKSYFRNILCSSIRYFIPIVKLLNRCEKTRLKLCK